MRAPTHAGGVVYRENDRRILLVRAKPEPHDWVLPKGHIEKDETPEETAAREIREEAGVAATVLEPLGMISFTKPNGKDAHVACFLMRYDRDVPADEDREIRWSTIDEAIELIPFENTRDVLTAARDAMSSR